MKTCTKCGIEKDESCYHRMSQAKDGLRPDCRECNYEANKEGQRAYRQTINGRYTVYKKGSKQRGLAFNLTKEQFASFWQTNCFYCGDQIATVGLDRIDSSQGYTADNCVACCWECNRIKSDRDIEFINTHMLKMLRFQGIVK